MAVDIIPVQATIDMSLEIGVGAVKDKILVNDPVRINAEQFMLAEPGTHRRTIACQGYLPDIWKAVINAAGRGKVLLQDVLPALDADLER